MELKVTSSTEQMKWIRDFLRRLMNFSHHLTCLMTLHLTIFASLDE